MTRKLPVASSEQNIVSNLRRTDPRLIHIEGWRIIRAHREWGSSEDFGDETKIFDSWIPDNTAEEQVNYLLDRIGDISRALRELEVYNTQLVREKRELREKLEASQ